MKRFIIINGPNLNLLGIRQPEIYGSQTFNDFLDRLREEFPEFSLEYFQSNHEGDLIDKIHEVGFSYDGIVFNPAAYTHTSIALADAIAAVDSPVIEVHISDIKTREPFRHISYVEPYCIATISGRGLNGYRDALLFFLSGDD